MPRYFRYIRCLLSAPSPLKLDAQAVGQEAFEERRVPVVAGGQGVVVNDQVNQHGPGRDRQQRIFLMYLSTPQHAVNSPQCVHAGQNITYAR